jgi:hypothetical protein
MELTMADFSKQIVIEVEVKGLKIFTIRLKIACFLIQLAAKIAGMGIEIRRIET